MTIYKFQEKMLEKLETTTFSNEGILERYDLQASLKQKIDVIAPNCLVIAEEFGEWLDSKRRIDLLAIDKDANLVVIELKRNETGEHMELQALRYAAMVSTLTFSRAVEIYQRFLDKINNGQNAENNILEFLSWDESHEEDFAMNVRIILVSSDFSKEITTTVLWLNERDIDIRCIRLIPYKDHDQILIDVQQIIPLPETESYLVKIKEQAKERREAQGSTKDRSEYRFNGKTYKKGKLVVAVIQCWIAENKPTSVSELLNVFPQNLVSGGLCIPVDKAQEIYDQKGKCRHFLDDNAIIKFPDSEQYAISNQWGKDNIPNFINQAKKAGFEIEKVS